MIVMVVPVAKGKANNCNFMVRRRWKKILGFHMTLGQNGVKLELAVQTAPNISRLYLKKTKATKGNSWCSANTFFLSQFLVEI